MFGGLSCHGWGGGFDASASHPPQLLAEAEATPITLAVAISPDGSLFLPRKGPLHWSPWLGRCRQPDDCRPVPVRQFSAAADRIGSSSGKIQTRERLGGFLKVYHRAAA